MKQKKINANFDFIRNRPQKVIHNTQNIFVKPIQAQPYHNTLTLCVHIILDCLLLTPQTRKDNV